MNASDLAEDAAKSKLRRRAILEAAREAFLEQGFAATSMSEIAARVGGSKTTLYNYFRSKEELFAAFMIDFFQDPANALFEHLPASDSDLRAALIELAAALLGFVLRPQTMAVHRLVVAEVGRFPEIGRIFDENGPSAGQARLQAFFAGPIARGQMRACDVEVAARRFKDLVLSDIYTRRLWGVSAPATTLELRGHAIASVDVFLAAFGPEGSAGPDANADGGQRGPSARSADLGGDQPS